MNERITENILKNILKENNYYDDENLIIEEQQSKHPEINNLLSKSSKNSNRKGFPDFIIRSKKDNLIILIECKCNLKNHKSKEFPNILKPKEYAVDGACHYSKYIKNKYNVIFIGFSGEDENYLKIESYFQPEKSIEFNQLEINEIVSYKEYISLINKNFLYKNIQINKINKIIKSIHKTLKEKLKITDENKPILLSLILLSFCSKNFVYKNINNNKEMIDLLLFHSLQYLKTIEESEKFSSEKFSILENQFKYLVDSEKTLSQNSKNDLLNLTIKIREIYENFEKDSNPYSDYLAEFYKEFLKFTDKNQKNKGIVLTPQHITELFANIANLSIHDKILDPCCGTGSFLISSMNYLINKYITDNDIKKIKKECLIGIEENTKMFSLAATNMILRKDGKSNLIRDDIFEKKVKILFEERKIKPTIGMINPPYSISDNDHELKYVERMMELLSPKGLGIAIIPISSISNSDSNNEYKKKILENNNLIAVMSMPEQLFYPVGVVTCIIVLRKEIHNGKTWLAYWRDDGFKVLKHKGRIDLNNKWKNIMKNWVDSYFDKKDIPQNSINVSLDYKSDWAAECYLRPDFTKINFNEIEKLYKNYQITKIRLENEDFELEEK